MLIIDFETTGLKLDIHGAKYMVMVSKHHCRQTFSTHLGGRRGAALYGGGEGVWGVALRFFFDDFLWIF